MLPGWSRLSMPLNVQIPPYGGRSGSRALLLKAFKPGNLVRQDRWGKGTSRVLQAGEVCLPTLQAKVEDRYCRSLKNYQQYGHVI